VTNREKIAIYIPTYGRERNTLSEYSELRLTFHKVDADIHLPSSGARPQTSSEGHHRRTSRETRLPVTKATTVNGGNIAESGRHTKEGPRLADRQ